jgi:hypothetical protein
MATWADPVERADRIQDLPAAAKLMDSFAARLYDNPGLPPEQAERLDEALGVLRERFPELDDPDLATTARRDHATRSQSRRGKARPRARASTGRAASQSPGGAGRSRASSRPRATRSRGRGGSRARAAWRQTGVPGAASSATSLALQAIGLTIGLSLLYLFLTNTQRAPRGRSAVELLSAGVSEGVRRVIAPVDPLAPGRPLTRTARRAARPPRRAGPTAVQP